MVSGPIWVCRLIVMYWSHNIQFIHFTQYNSKTKYIYNPLLGNLNPLAITRFPEFRLHILYVRNKCALHIISLCMQNIDQTMARGTEPRWRRRVAPQCLEERERIAVWNFSYIYYSSSLVFSSQSGSVCKCSANMQRYVVRFRPEGAQLDCVLCAVNVLWGRGAK